MNMLTRLFSGNTAPQTSSSSTAAPSESPAASTGNTANTANTTPQNPQGTDFTKLWENTGKQPENTEIFKGLTKEALDNAAATQDFMRTIPAELLDKLKAGGEDAMQTLPSLLNAALQQSFSNNTLVTTKLIQEALTAQESKWKELLPGIIKQTTAADNFKSTNEVFKDPAYAPIISAVQKQVHATFGKDSSASELNRITEEFLTKFASDISKKQTTNDSNSQPEFMDWSKFNL